MSRRWKITFALFVLGMGGLLVWAFNSPPTPPLSIRFYGYVTNDASRPIAELPPPDGSIFAVFVVTNQTRHVLRAEPWLATRNPGKGTGPQIVWHQHGRGHGPPSGDDWILKPGKSALTGMVVSHAGAPVRVSVKAYSPKFLTPSWRRYWDQLPWNQHTYSVSASNDWR